jgi:peptide deformylase
MALRNILTNQDPVLKKQSRQVTEFNSRIGELLDDLKETLDKAQGLGLAAPQVGILRKVAIVLIDDEEILELINPEVTSSEGAVGIDEACLSCPGILGYVVRPEKITVEAFDRDGNEYSREFEGINARAVCHEIDHLNGILFTDIAERVFSADEIDESSSAEPKEQT